MMLGVDSKGGFNSISPGHFLFSNTPPRELTCDATSANFRLRKPVCAPKVVFSLGRSPKSFVNGRWPTIPHACIHYTAETTPDTIEGCEAVVLIGQHNAGGLLAPEDFEMGDLAQLDCVGAYSHIAFHHPHLQDTSSTSPAPYPLPQDLQPQPDFPYYEDIKFDPTMPFLVGSPPVQLRMTSLIA